MGNIQYIELDPDAENKIIDCNKNLESISLSSNIEYTEDNGIDSTFPKDIEIHIRND